MRLSNFAPIFALVLCYNIIADTVKGIYLNSVYYISVDLAAMQTSMTCSYDQVLLHL